MALTTKQIKRLEESNWREDNSVFHKFHSQDELLAYLNRSSTGKSWREEYGKYDFEQCVFQFEVFQWEGVFNEPVHFLNATFQEKVTFRGIIFNEKADFRGCQFLGGVDFSGCKFTKAFD